MHVRDADRQHRYTCWGCDTRLVAVMGARVQHHWRHWPEPGEDHHTTCTGESAEHYATKSWVAAQRWLTLACHVCGEPVDVTSDRGVTENPLGQYRIDAALYEGAVPVLYVEVRRSHPVDGAKRVALDASGVPWVEIESLECGEYEPRALCGRFCGDHCRKVLATPGPGWQHYEYDGEDHPWTHYRYLTGGVVAECRPGSVHVLREGYGEPDTVLGTRPLPADGDMSTATAMVRQIVPHGFCGHCGAVRRMGQRGRPYCAAKCWLDRDYGHCGVCYTALRWSDRLGSTYCYQCVQDMGY